MPRGPNRRRTGTRNAEPVSQATRARITAAALELFNAEGTHAISTRHVAAALGMSPGNLYYHFDNKEEIIAALYAELEADLRDLLQPPPPGPQSFTAVLGYVDRIFDHLWRYRFFYRDLPALLPTVPGLGERYRALAGQVCADARAIYAQMVAAGWMEATPDQLDLLAENGWIILTNWLPYRQMRDGRATIEAHDISEGVRHFAALFGAHLKPGPRRELEAMVTRYAALSTVDG
jgi:AcrR family transcriptional regulator